jgi:hypothetical protein
VICYLLCQLVYNFLLGFGRLRYPFLRYNISPRHLGRLFLDVNPDYCHVFDIRVGGKVTFKLGGRNLEAFVFDKLLDAIGYVEVSVFVLMADITGLSGGLISRENHVR